MCELDFTIIDGRIKYAFGVAFICIGIAAVCGNIIALVSIFKSTRTNRSDILLISLASNDLIIGLLICPFLGIEQFLNYYPDVCNFQAPGVSSLFCITSLNVALIAFYKCFILARETTEEDFLSMKTLVFCVVGSWLLPPMVTSISYFFLLKVFVSIINSIFIITLLVMLVCYALIILYIKRTKQSLKNFQNTKINASQQTLSLQMKAARKVTVLVLCYVVCFLPIVACILINLFYVDGTKVRTETLETIFLFADFISCFNAFLNPWIYTTIFKNLKRSTKYRLIKEDHKRRKNYGAVLGQ
uniref:G-protein coupled receptors family 1 profile domain-containing protein n=1 Tax=Clytia hemisphaerica TaxID=252671 RepID=A0A7M5V230_9CNID